MHAKRQATNNPLEGMGVWGSAQGKAEMVQATRIARHILEDKSFIFRLLEGKSLFLRLY